MLGSRPNWPRAKNEANAAPFNMRLDTVSQYEKGAKWIRDEGVVYENKALDRQWASPGTFCPHRPSAPAARTIRLNIQADGAVVRHPYLIERIVFTGNVGRRDVPYGVSLGGAANVQKPNG
jgi:hypothetical protein